MPLFFSILFIILVLYLFCIFPRLSGRKRMEMYRHTQFAHRGYHCKERGVPENSMVAFQAAITHGYGIELDIHLTLDKKLVVFHDDTLDRVCNVPGSIEQLTYDELKTCSLLGTHERIPLFHEVLQTVNGAVPILIEIKIPTHSTEVCEAAFKMLQTYNGPYLVQSFNTMGIRWFKLHAPEVLRGQLSSNLLKSETPEPVILKLLVRYLLINFLGRPDFISYKLASLPNLSVSFLKNICHTPIAVWTLRTEKALKIGISDYDMQIFEKHHENY